MGGLSRSQVRLKTCQRLEPQLGNLPEQLIVSHLVTNLRFIHWSPQTYFHGRSATKFVATGWEPQLVPYSGRDEL